MQGFTCHACALEHDGGLNFDGAMMDKLTYAALKGLDVDLSKVTVI